MSDLFRAGRPDFRYFTRSIQIRFWYKYRASLHAQASGPVHRVYLERKWNEREKNGLWSQVVCPLPICSKSTVRRHHGRRLRDAFKKALDGRGLDEHGKAIDGQGASLDGTLHLLAQSSIVQATPPELRKECAHIVSKLIELNQQGVRKVRSLSSGSGKPTPPKTSSNNRIQHHKSKGARQSKNTVIEAPGPMKTMLQGVQKTQSAQHYRKV
jgi:hypothetical protein